MTLKDAPKLRQETRQATLRDAKRRQATPSNAKQRQAGLVLLCDLFSCNLRSKLFIHVWKHSISTILRAH